MSLVRRIKALSFALAAVLVFSAFAASVVQANLAPRWTVIPAGGSPTTLAAGVEKPFTMSNTNAITVTTPFGFNYVSTTANGDCTATGKMVGSGVGSPGTIKDLTLTCKNVEVEEFPACDMHSPGLSREYVSTDVKGTLVWLNQTGDAEAGILLQPQTEGGALFHLTTGGAECAVSQPEFTVTGTLIGKIGPMTQDLAEGTIEFPVTQILKYWSNATPRVEQSIKDDRLKIINQNISFRGVFDGKPETAGEKFGIEPG